MKNTLRVAVALTGYLLGTFVIYVLTNIVDMGEFDPSVVGSVLLGAWGVFVVSLLILKWEKE